MGWLSALIGSGITASAGIYQQDQLNDFNREEARKNRVFQSEQAELNRLFQSDEAALQRDWSAAEAERARDWQEEMYAKYNSLSGKIQQAEDAGVNPMFAVTGDAVSPAPTSTSLPSGASAGSVGTPSGATATAAFVDIIGQVLGFKKMQAEVDLMESQAGKNRAETEGQNITNEQLRDMNSAEIMSKLSQVELNDANIELISAKVLNTNADTDVKGAQLGQIASQIANSDADTAVKQKQLALMTSEILKNTKSLDVMDAQIREMLSVAGKNRAEAKNLAQEFRNLVQEYDTNEFIRKANQLAEPDGSEDDFSKFFYKLVALFK